MIVFVIEEIRENKNISQYKLSQMTGLSRTYIRNLEKNKTFNPTMNVLLLIAKALNVNVKDLFYTKLDIEVLKEKLNITIDKYGLHSKEVMEVSHIIDLLINISAITD